MTDERKTGSLTGRLSPQSIQRLMRADSTTCPGFMTGEFVGCVECPAPCPACECRDFQPARLAMLEELQQLHACGGLISPDTVTELRVLVEVALAAVPDEFSRLQPLDAYGLRILRAAWLQLRRWLESITVTVTPD
jgi:hypothetical protein